MEKFIGRIYKLISSECKEVYIGSTIKTLKERLLSHRWSYTRYLNGTFAYLTAYEILKYVDVKIELLFEGEFNTKREMHRLEGEYIKNTENCINRCIMGFRKEYLNKYKQTHQDQIKEYREKNKDKQNAYNKEYYILNKDKIKAHLEKNKDQIKEKAKEYREKNIDKIKEKEKEYREKNIDTINEKKREHYRKNIDKILEKKREYDEKNKDKIKEYRLKNAETIREKTKAYREKNKEKIHAKVTCEICGFEYTLQHRTRHIKSQRHQEKIEVKEPNP